MIPVSRVVLEPEVEHLVLEVLRSGHLAQGPRVAELEGLVVGITGAAHAVAVANGTLALVAALQALDLEPGDEVVTSPFTFVATLNAALEAGATVRFADIDPVTYTVDANALAAACTDRTRVLLPVHLYGQCAAMHQVAALADRHDLRIIEDAAQALGATVDGRGAGAWGLGCFSLYATKNVTTGEGGVVTTDDDMLADRLRLLRNQGMRARYQYELAGHNYRMTDLQAAVGIPQLRSLSAMVAKRSANAATLCEQLSGIEGLVLPSIAPGHAHVWHQFTVRVTADARLDRDTLAASLADEGVGSGVYYPKVAFDYDCYRSDPRVIIDDVPEATRAATQVLSLPVHPHLSAHDIDHVAEAVRKLLGG